METKFCFGKPAMTTDFTSNRARFLSEYRNDGRRCLAAIGARLRSRFKKGQSRQPARSVQKEPAGASGRRAQLARVRHAIAALFRRGSEDRQTQGSQPVCAMLGGRFLTGKIARTKRATDVLPGSHRNPGIRSCRVHRKTGLPRWSRPPQRALFLPRPRGGGVSVRGTIAKRSGKRWCP